MPGCHRLLAWNRAHLQNVRKNERPAPNLKKSWQSPAIGAASLLLELSIKADAQVISAFQTPWTISCCLGSQDSKPPSTVSLGPGFILSKWLLQSMLVSHRWKLKSRGEQASPMLKPGRLRVQTKPILRMQGAASYYADVSARLGQSVTLSGSWRM